jgi:hypothetical protein
LPEKFEKEKQNKTKQNGIVRERERDKHLWLEN